MNHERTVRNSAVEKLMSGGRICSGTELESAEKHFAFGMSQGVGFDPLHEVVWVVGGDAQFGSGEIESTQCQSSEPHVRVGVRNSGDHSTPMQIDQLGVAVASGRYFLVSAHRVNPRSGQCQSFDPQHPVIAGINMAMDQDGVAREQSPSQKGAPQVRF